MLYEVKSKISGSIKGYIKGNYEWFVILTILLFNGINNYYWLKLDKAPPRDDEAYHLVGALDILDHSSDVIEMIRYGLNVTILNFYPPLYHTVMAISNLIFGRSEISSVMANMPFMLILVLSLYYTGKKISDKNTGLLAGFLIMMYPYVFDISRLPLPDFALTSILALSFCLLLYSELFTKTIPSVLFGISFGIGMYIKQVYIFFICAPLLFK
jgi:4-amino-4-deoxy-L-arabinose transferase-like glycosyltransferase